MSVQIWEAAQAALPGLEEQFERGDFSALGTWLRENLYSLGRKLTPKETLERVAGGPIDPEPYLRYLQSKHGAGATADPDAPNAGPSSRAIGHADRG